MTAAEKERERQEREMRKHPMTTRSMSSQGTTARQGINIVRLPTVQESKTDIERDSSIEEDDQAVNEE